MVKRKRTGRPPKARGEVRGVIIRLRLTRGEFRRVTKEARREAGGNLSALLRRRILGGGK